MVTGQLKGSLNGVGSGVKAVTKGRIDGVAGSERVVNARKAAGKQWSGREAAKVWKQCRTSVECGEPLAGSYSRNHCVEGSRWKAGGKLGDEGE